MSEEFDFLEDDEDREDDEEEEQPESTLDPESIRKLSARYRATPLGEAREELWESLSEDEQEHLEAAGVSGPRYGSLASYKPVTLDKKELRGMDAESRKEARDEFEKVTARAKATFEAGLKAILRRELDVDQETLDRLAEIRDDAAKADDNERSLLLQEGAARIAAIRQTDTSKAFNPGNVQKRRQYLDPLTRRMMLDETDGLGNTRTIEQTREEHAELYVRAPDKLPEFVTVDEFLTWTPDKQVRFVRERPQGYERLKRQAEQPDGGRGDERMREVLKNVRA